MSQNGGELMSWSPSVSAALHFCNFLFYQGYNALHDYTVDAFSCLEKFIESDPSSVITVEQARNATEVIFPIMSKAYGRAFDKLEVGFQYI